MTDFERLIARAYHRYGPTLFAKRFHLLHYLFMVTGTGVEYNPHSGTFKYNPVSCGFDVKLRPEEVVIDPVWNEINLEPVELFVKQIPKDQPHERLLFERFYVEQYQGDFERFQRDGYIQTKLKSLILVRLQTFEGTNLHRIAGSKAIPETKIREALKDFHRYIQQAHDLGLLQDPTLAAPTQAKIEEVLTPWGGL